MAPARKPPRGRYRMKELCELSGLTRQSIHYYIREGLLPEGKKAGKNMAWYDDDHVARLALIRKLQQERLLPLKAIKALLDRTPDAGGDDAHREMLLELKSKLSGELAPRGGEVRDVDARRAAERLNLAFEDVVRMAEIGVLALLDADTDRPRVPAESMWLLELWSQIRALGFSAELGFTVDDLLIYEELVARMFEREVDLVTQRLGELPPDQVASMMTRVLPLIHAFVAHYHTARVRDFFTGLDE